MRGSWPTLTRRWRMSVLRCRRTPRRSLQTTAAEGCCQVLNFYLPQLTWQPVDIRSASGTWWSTPSPPPPPTSCPSSPWCLSLSPPSEWPSTPCLGSRFFLFYMTLKIVLSSSFKGSWCKGRGTKQPNAWDHRGSLHCLVHDGVFSQVIFCIAVIGLCLNIIDLGTLKEYL